MFQDFVVLLCVSPPAAPAEPSQCVVRIPYHVNFTVTTLRAPFFSNRSCSQSGVSLFLPCLADLLDYGMQAGGTCDNFFEVLRETLSLAGFFLELRGLLAELFSAKLFFLDPDDHGPLHKSLLSKLSSNVMKIRPSKKAIPTSLYSLL